MRITCIALVWLLLFSGASAAESYTDGTGREIAYGQDCQRIVSLMPNLTEMVAFIGFANRLVGKSSYCNYPDSILSVDDVGGQVDASLEKIVALQPDIVLAYQGNSLELVDQLRQLDIQVCAFREALTVDEIAAQMDMLSNILGPSSERPSAIGSEWLAELNVAVIPAGSREDPSVFFGYPGELVYTAGRNSFISDAISRCGGHNVVELPERWPSVSAEYIMAADPDWILTTTSCTEDEDPADARAEMLAQLRQDPVFGELRAVRQGHLIVVNSDHLLRPGPRIRLALLEICRQLSAPVAGSAGNHGASAAR